MKALALALIGASLAASPSQPATAKVGDKAWAQCVWQTDAEAAANWIKLKAPSWQDVYSSPAELLGYRLIAVCDATAADPKRPNRLPNWKAMQQQLVRSRPKEAVDAVETAVAAKLCESYATNGTARALYLAEVVREEGGSTIVVHQAYFDDAGTDAVKVVDYAGRSVSFQLGGVPVAGSAIRMPQDTLIASPADGYVSERVCRTIGSTGELGVEGGL